MKTFLYDRFKLNEHGTTIRKEIIAGLTTFFAMAYIIFVNPSFLGTTGMNMQSVLIATCISAAVGTFLMGILSNYPLAQAPGMGLNAMFAFTICGSMGYSWQAALAAVFISGIIFIILTVTGVRKAIVSSIPASIKKAISVGIGLFIALIGFANGGLVAAGNGTPTQLLPFNNPLAIMTIIGLVITILLLILKVRGAIFIGLISSAILCIAVGGIHQAASGSDAWMQSLGISFNFNWSFDFSTAGQFVFGFKDLFAGADSVGLGIVSIITILLTLTMVDLFDTMGTLIGAAEKGGFLDENGNLPRIDSALLADAVATSFGAILGTSTVTTYVESTAGIAEGGRTGLTSMVVGILFLVSIVLYPFVGLISSAATAPALIIVGVMMITSVSDIDWKDITVAIPCFFTLAIMPFGYSIADGIGFGFITYVLIKVTLGVKDIIVNKKGVKAGETLEGEALAAPEKKVGPFGVHVLMYVFAALFALRYIFLAISDILFS